MLGYIKTVTFSSGDVLFVDPNATVLIVGPNNSGKSQALKDIQNHLLLYPQQHQPLAVSRIEYEKSSTGIQVQAWLEDRSTKTPSGPNDFMLNRLGSSVIRSSVSPSWDAGPPFTGLGAQLVQLFTPSSVQTLINNANLINPETDQGTQALHFVFLNPELERRLSELSTEAFGIPIFLNRYGVPQLALHFGNLPSVPSTAPPYPREFLRDIGQVPLVTNQGDGIKSFVGIALAAMSTPFPHLLLDEPEAFLHPPQARLLGRVLHQQHPESQLFIATHDGNLLKGLLAGEEPNVAVWRMTRVGNSNHCVQLSADAIRELWADPLLRTSNILEGLFHRGVVVSEGDADARLYELAISEASPPIALSSDLFYTFAGGKQRIPMVLRALRSVGVVVAAVADFDVLREEEPLKSIVEALEGSWDAVAAIWQPVKNAIDADTRIPTRTSIREEVSRLLDGSSAPALSRQEQEAFRAVLHGDTGWDRTRRSGVAGLAHGALVTQTKMLMQRLAELGLFVVPVGELEGWAPEIGGHGPNWLGSAVQYGVHRRNVDLIAFVREVAAFALGA